MKAAGFLVVRSLDGDGAWLVPPGEGYNRYRRGLFLPRPNIGFLSQGSKNRYATFKGWLPMRLLTVCIGCALDWRRVTA